MRYLEMIGIAIMLVAGASIPAIPDSYASI